MKIFEPSNNYEKQLEDWGKKQLEKINKQIEEIKKNKETKYKIKTPITPKNKKVKKTYFV